MEIKLMIEFIFLAIAIGIVYSGIKVLSQGEKKIDQVITDLTRK